MCSISPLEERYRTEIADLFTEEAKLKRWLKVEVALAKAHAKIGNIKEEDAKRIEEAAKRVNIEEVKKMEEKIKHDLMAMVKVLAEKAGNSGAYVHLGATSYDIEDTATALLFKDALLMIENRIKKLLEVLKKLAREKKDLICVARTHGQHAVPTTYGMKFALYYYDIKRSLERINEMKKRALRGKMSGAVGTMASFGEKGFEIEELIMKELGLEVSKINTQVIQRDIHAEVMINLALLSSIIEKIAKEIRNLQRTEIGEVSEPFELNQVGSSTMPQKKNPYRSERICSLARKIRANVQIALENIALEHERDLTNSANERFLFAENFILTDFIIKEITEILENLEFSYENIKKNLELTRGLIFAERVMIFLVEKRIMGRQEAHEFVKKLSLEADKKNKTLKEVLIESEIGKKISEKEIEKLFNYESYIGLSEKIIERALL